MSDLDEDLLALAGDVGEDTASRKRSAKRSSTGGSKRRKTKDNEDNDDLELGEEDEVEDEEDEEDVEDDLDDLDVGPKSRRRNKSELDENEDDEEQQEEEFVHPYPIMDKYKDEKDRKWLESLEEIQREEILFERSQEMQAYNERIYLAQRLKDSKRSGKATRSSTRDTPKGSSVKRNQLSELKKKREEKTVRDRQRSNNEPVVKLRYDDEEDDEADEGEDEAYKYADENEEVEWAESTGPTKTLNVDLINQVKFGRTSLAKFCHYPEFERVVVDSFVRMNIGVDRRTNKETYRLCQVKAVIETKPYTFMNRTVNQNLLCAFGSNEKTFGMGFLSDRPFTDAEFDKWKAVLEEEKIAIPSVRFIETKAQQLQKMKDRTLTPEEVNLMIETRQKLSTNDRGNSVMRKTLLEQKKIIAESNNDANEVARIEEQLADIDERQTVRLSSTVNDSPLQRLSRVNERNRRANQDEIRKAEIRASEERRKQLQNKSFVSADPFSRLKTNARMYYDHTEEIQGPGQGDVPADDNIEEAETVEGQIKQKKLAEDFVKQPLSAVDDVIASTNFGVEIDLGLDL
ncbi:hypothetical protein V1514DRAFT_287286 [Lipomyces japonicus]|uniref:uncharacterized protein n=1 Tax=Lipomyces japonicus TaxID=56871 RepID=UPI0034CD74A8